MYKIKYKLGDEIMSDKLKRDEISKGIHFNSVFDKKFKHNRISVNFVIPLEKGKVSQNVIVPFILKQGFKQCNTFRQLSKKLDNLYGASLDCDISKFGSNHILSIFVVGLDNKYALEKENLIEEYADLLSNIVFEPNIINNLFEKDVVEREKNNIVNIIESEINDKRGYSITKCIELMYNEDGCAIKKYGYKNEALEITQKDVVDGYKNILEKSQIEIMFVGCGDSSSAKKVFTDKFKTITRNPIKLKEICNKIAREEVIMHTEEMEVSQGKLVMGFKSGENISEHQRRATRLMTAMFGGTPVSLLFKNVREKLSLCYYCAARYNEVTGSLIVDSGVEMENKEKAYTEILNQLDVIKNNEFTDDELLYTKLIIATAIKATTDSLYSSEMWYLSHILNNANISPELELELINKITREDIVAVSQNVKLDTVYFLKSKGER